MESDIEIGVGLSVGIHELKGQRIFRGIVVDGYMSRLSFLPFFNNHEDSPRLLLRTDPEIPQI